MYKNHITKWKLDKRNKESEVMAVVRKKHQRDAVGKASEFHLRGRLVDLDDVHRYLKRKGMSIENAIELNAATPPELRCCTPDAVPRSVHRYLKRKSMSIKNAIELNAATPPELRRCTPDAVPRSPANPEIFEVAQRVLIKIRHYIFGSRDSETWFLSANSEFYLSVKGASRGGTLADFQVNLEAACNLLNTGSHTRAGQFLVSGSAYIQDILLEEAPRTLEAVFYVMMMFQKHGWVDCGNIIVKQLSGMATAILPEMHPLRQIFNHLQSLGLESAKDFLPNAWACLADMLEEALDASSLTVLQSRLGYIHHVESTRNLNKADAQLRTMVERCREVHGRFSSRYAEATLALATFLRYHRQYIEAAAAAEEVIRCGREGRFSYATQMWREGMVTLAHCQYQNYDDKQAELTLRQAIDVAIANWGWEAGQTLQPLTILEEWLTQFGKHEEAAEVSERLAEILRQSNAFV